jgi:bifunctional non-homologous end joining protein LigD
MAQKLSAYHAKRDFAATPEPRGRAHRAGKALSFVIQKHDARRLHYDFRLELDGTLKSWAVPKGPSFDPHDKRLAVHVEDHPLEYGSFEGTIPPGHYGAGTVIVWDRGEWIPQGDPLAGYRAGKLKFTLRGEKLHGDWTLVRTHGRGGTQDQWLLIKEKDAAARPANEYDVTSLLPDSVLQAPKKATKKAVAKTAARKTAANKAEADPAPGIATLPGARKAALPRTLEPQLATLVDAVPGHGDWRYEVKLDGYRILARLENGKARLITRNGHDWTAKLPAQRRALESLPLRQGWIDGELVVFGAHGVPDFQALQNAFDQNSAERSSERMALVVFDLPFAAGYDLRQTPLELRRDWLRHLVADHVSSVLRFSETIAEAPERLLEAACRMRLEGLIGKEAHATYSSGRGRSWIKLKCQQRQEFVIGGYTEPRGTRVGIGALLLGVYDEHGQLRYAGRVGTGFDDRLLLQMKARLEKLSARSAPFTAGPKPATASEKAHWVEPKLVAEVRFAEWTGEGLVRQAVFEGLRMDKPAKEIRRERAAHARTRADTGEERVHGIRVTHGDRVIDPASGITKIELVRYYEAIASYLLPHLRARPVSMVRAPEGIAGELIFQKHMQKTSIPHIRLLDPGLDPGHPSYVVAENVDAIVEAAQMGVVEFHTWNATDKSIEKPDRVVFDLDPDPELPWSRVVEGAELTRALLDELGLKSFLKTSGGKGLHLVVPLIRRYDWDTVKDFSQDVAQHLAATLPDRFSAKMGAKNRVRKIFVDYLRNGRGSSTISAFSARTRPYLPVSVPLAWDELPELKSAAQWTIRNVLERLRSLPADPWHDYEKSRQPLAAAMRRLGEDRVVGLETA